jgi:hypothetical protein
VLSLVLTTTTLAPHALDDSMVVGLAAGVMGFVAVTSFAVSRGQPRLQVSPAEKLTWTMPPLDSLRPPQRSTLRTAGLIVLRCYLGAAVIVLAVQVVRLALGAGSSTAAHRQRRPVTRAAGSPAGCGRCAR